MTELKITHVLLLAVAAFLLYHFMSGCGNGFSVGEGYCTCAKFNDVGDCIDPKNHEDRSLKYCTGAPNPDECRTAGGRSFISPGTCKWINTPPSPPPPPMPPTQNAQCKCGDGEYEMGSKIQYNPKFDQCEIPSTGPVGQKGTIAHWSASECTNIHNKSTCNQKQVDPQWFHRDPRGMPACKWDDNYQPCSYKDETKCNNDKNCSWCMELNGDKQRCNTLDNAKKLVDSGAFKCHNLPPSN